MGEIYVHNKSIFLNERDILLLIYHIRSFVMNKISLYFLLAVNTRWATQ